MTSEYIRITIITPANYIEQANQLAKVIGYTEFDGYTFGEPNYKDSENNLYSVASGLVSPSFVMAAQSELIQPDYDVDMTAAIYAQSLIQLYDAENNPCQVDPDHITAIINEDVLQALSLVGCYPIE